MNERRKSVVERYKKSYNLFHSNETIGWHRALRENELSKHYPHIDLDKSVNNTRLDNKISDILGFANLCMHKDPDCLAYCTRVVIRYNLLPDRIFNHMANTVNDVSRQLDIDFMSDAEIIEQVRKRGLYIGADGKYHKKEIIEKVIDIE